MHLMQVILLLYFTLLKGIGFFLQVQQPSGSDRNHCDDGLYARVSPKRPRADQTAGKTPESTDSEKINYTTVQHVRNNESNYENLRVHHPDSAAR